MPRARSHADTSKSSASPRREVSWHGIWSGTVSFSLVAIPVQLVKAVEPGRVSFRTLHRKDYSPLARRMFCPKEEVLVPPEEIIRGFEIGPDKYIVVTDEELESVSPERSRTIEISEFIDMSEVDPIYFDHPYYLVPAKGGEKSYRLLVEIMARANKAGLAKFVLHEREYLVAVKSIEGALALITLHYSEEILSEADIAPKEVKINAQEKNRFKKTIEKMLTDFNPNRYADARRAKDSGSAEKEGPGSNSGHRPGSRGSRGRRSGRSDRRSGGEHAPGKEEPVSPKVIEIAGKSLSLANLEKNLYPAYGFTKAQILEYYRRMAPFILPHLQDRALTLKRYPEGVDQDYFFEKRCPVHRPAWVQTAQVSLDKGRGDDRLPGQQSGNPDLGGEPGVSGTACAAGQSQFP